MSPLHDSGAPGIGRRELLRRGAAALLVVGAAGPLAACTQGGTSGRPVKTTRPDASDTTADSPKTSGEPDRDIQVAEILLLHHALGLTRGVRAFADRLRKAGHTVHTPDLYDGKTFATLEQGVAHAEKIGLDAFRERAVRVADRLPNELVYIGWSLGVLPAQQLAQTRPGARAAVLLEGCVPPATFGTSWPAQVPVQIHGMDADPFFAGEGDIDAARALVEEAEDGELFTYRGDQHLFIDSSLPSYDAAAASLVVRRVTAFLRRS